ncbi:MAG: hypothetical protein ABI573_11125 [Chloroflexota bacterium]
MTDSPTSLQTVAFPRAADSQWTIPAVRSIRLPAHLGVLMGLSAGAYALCLAGVTGLQSMSEAQLAVDRAPAIETIRAVQQDHDQLEARLATARSAYGAAAEAYRASGTGFAAMEARLNELATLMTEISGTTATLPSSVKLPSVSKSVSRGAAPAVHATTTASGG